MLCHCNYWAWAALCQQMAKTNLSIALGYRLHLSFAYSSYLEYSAERVDAHWKSQRCTLGLCLLQFPCCLAVCSESTWCTHIWPWGINCRCPTKCVYCLQPKQTAGRGNVQCMSQRCTLGCVCCQAVCKEGTQCTFMEPWDISSVVLCVFKFCSILQGGELTIACETEGCTAV